MSPLKKDAYTACIAIVIFTVVNLIGGMVNDHYKYAFGFSDVLEYLPFHLVFCFLFWLTCIPKIKIRKSLRLPVIRALIWTIIVIRASTGHGPQQMATWDFMYDMIPAFCFFVNTVGMNVIDWPDNFYLYGILIIGVTAYQVFVLELSRWMVGKMYALQSGPEILDNDDKLSRS